MAIDVNQLSYADTNYAAMPTSAVNEYRKELGSDKDPTSLAKIADKHRTVLPEWPGFVKELFGFLFDPSGMTTKPVDRNNAGVDLITGVIAQSNWIDLCATTKGQPLAAAMAAVKIAEGLAKELQLGTASNQTDLQRILDAYAEGVSLREKIKNIIRRSSEKITQMIASAIKIALDVGDAVLHMTDSGIVQGPNNPNGPRPSEKLLRTVTSIPGFNKIFDLCGKMLQESEELYEDLAEFNITPSGLTKAKEITEVISSELGTYFVDPLGFIKRFTEGELLGTEREDYQAKEKGDIIILVDRSGSMGLGHRAGPYEPVTTTRLMWAQALAISCIVQAKKENRRWVYASYDDADAPMEYSTCELGIEHAIGAIASVTPRGGTETDFAIRKLVGLCNGTWEQDHKGKRLYKGSLPAILKTPLKDPDILLITDGAWERLSGETIYALEYTETRLFMLQLGGGYSPVGGVAIPEGVDRMWMIDDEKLNDVKAAAQVLVEMKIPKREKDKKGK